MLPKQVTGQQISDLGEAITDALNLDALGLLVESNLGFKLANRVSTSKAFRYVVHDLIATLNGDGHTDRLILLLENTKPDNPKVRAFMDSLGESPVASFRVGLESVVDSSSRFHDVNTWIQNITACTTRICRIDTPNPNGTGFLVGPDLVLTNYHIVQKQIESGGWDGVKCVFDFKRTLDDVAAGVPYELANDPLIDHSPYDQKDLVHNELNTPRDPEKLDYALLRLAKPAGDDPVAGLRGPVPPPRGAFSLPATAPAPLPQGNSVVTILQHPKGDPMQLTQGPIIGFNQNQTRIRYKSTTIHGSSGSAVLDADLDLIALHHAGDPDWTDYNPADYNQGIPTWIIRQRIDKKAAGAGLS